MAVSVQRKRNLERVLLSWGGFILLIIVLFFLGRATYDVYEKSHIAALERISRINEFADLETRKSSLEAQLAK